MSRVEKLLIDTYVIKKFYYNSTPKYRFLKLNLCPNPKVKLESLLMSEMFYSILILSRESNLYFLCIL